MFELRAASGDGCPLRAAGNRAPLVAKEPCGMHLATPSPAACCVESGSAFFARSVRQRLISVGGAIVHPALEKWPPIGSRIDIAVWRQAVAVAVVKMQGVETIAVSVLIASRFRRVGNSCSQDKNREYDQSHRSHRGPSEDSFVRQQSVTKFRQRRHFDNADIRSKADTRDVFRKASGIHRSGLAKITSKPEPGRPRHLAQSEGGLLLLWGAVAANRTAGVLVCPGP